MIKQLFIFGLMLMVASCDNPRELKGFDAPKDVIPKEDMIEIIKEMTKLEAHVQSKYVSVVKFNKVMVESGDSLVRSKGYTRERYDESMRYYVSHQEEMKEMYNEALNRLNHELGELQSN